MAEITPPKVKLPIDVGIDMDEWRRDGSWGPVPKSYNDFQASLACAELQRLRFAFGLDVLRELVIDEGWFDGSKVLQVDVLTRTMRHVRLEWMDSNQAFGKKFLTSGGKGSLTEGDLA